MSDKELLELAAKASGRTLRYNSIGTQDTRHVWSPLEDDGDSRRLEVALKLRVTFWTSGVEVSTPDLHQTTFVRYDDVSGDEFAAARRAVVLAAAEIGKNM